VTLQIKTLASDRDIKIVAESQSWSVPKLVLYTAGNRYGPRDPQRGGDGWVKPSVLPIVEHYNDMLWSDFSNMNGSSFYPPHVSHQTGNDVDGRFSDGTYNAHSAISAQRMLTYLDDARYGSRIVCVFVSYAKVNTDSFWLTIQGKRLADGRVASNVILSVAGHADHFHWRITDTDDPAYATCPRSLGDD
jgi:hypothetical protein